MSVEEKKVQKKILGIMSDKMESGKMTADLEETIAEVLEVLLSESSKFTDVSRDGKQVDFEVSEEMIEKHGDREKAEKKAKEIVDKKKEQIKNQISFNIF